MLKRLATSGGRLFKLTSDRFTLAAGDMAGVGALFMALAITMDVALRYMFNAPTKWVNELSSYLLLVITFLGLAYTLREKGHIRADFLVRRLPTRVRNWVYVFGSIAFLIFTAFLFKFNLDLCVESVKLATRSHTGWDVPIAPWQAFIPLGLLLLGLPLIRNIYAETMIALGKSRQPDKESR